MEITQLPFPYAGKIYRSAMPYSSYDPDGELISVYENNDVSLIVMLASEEESIKITGKNLLDLYQGLGYRVIHLPIKDFDVPELDAVREVVDEVVSNAEAGGNVAVHCHAGVGRTGMFMAGIAKIGMGYSNEQAIQWVRESIPGAMETAQQEQLVRKLE